VVWPGLPVRSVKEAIAHLKANPGKLSYGTSGNGTLQHLSMELFLQGAKLSAAAVPYKGTGAAMPDLFSGRVPLLMSSLSTLSQHIRAKSVVALAVTTRERNASLPEVPTMIESGVPDFDVTQWQGVLVTKGTPATIIARLQRDIAASARMPAVAAHFAADGSTTVASTPAVFQQALAADRKRWAVVVQRAGISMQ
jgi:tripartite-type tricarboxylate transporter receptor subunit TctC